MQDTKTATMSPQAGRPGAAALAITVNGEGHTSTAATLRELLGELGYGASRVATAVNGEFVPERLRADRRLTAGDTIEVVAPRQGG